MSARGRRRYRRRMMRVRWMLPFPECLAPWQRAMFDQMTEDLATVPTTHVWLYSAPRLPEHGDDAIFYAHALPTMLDSRIVDPTAPSADSPIDWHHGEVPATGYARSGSDEPWPTITYDLGRFFPGRFFPGSPRRGQGETGA